MFVADTSTSALGAPSTKQQLVRTAERLFALHGIDGVSLRQIGVEAGMANNTAVQYHFGSKDGLIEAILMHRIEALQARRELLWARCSRDDLRQVVEAQLLPMIELGEDPDCYYLLVLEQLQRYGTGTHPFDQLPSAYQASQRRFVRRVGDLIGHVPARLRSARINQASAWCLHACADRQRARLFGAPVASYALHVSQLLDGVVAMLSSPASAETMAILAAPRRPPRLRVIP